MNYSYQVLSLSSDHFHLLDLGTECNDWNLKRISVLLQNKEDHISVIPVMPPLLGLPSDRWGLNILEKRKIINKILYPCLKKNQYVWKIKQSVTEIPLINYTVTNVVHVNCGICGSINLIFTLILISTGVHCAFAGEIIFKTGESVIAT